MATKQESDAQKDITKWAGKDGEFKRQASTFRSHIGPDTEFKAEKGRYQLYVSYACPWAHRTLITRKLKGLEEFIDVSVVHPHMGALGWSFYPPIRGEDGSYPKTTGEVGPDDGIAGVVPDPLYHAKFVRELYFRAEKDYGGRFTVPILWDKKTETIVNNESSEIIRMFNSEFNTELSDEFAKIDLYPEALREEIEGQHSWVYDTINNGVYKSGFATTQKAYENNVVPLFESLEKVEKILEGGKDFMVGDVQHFKCNINTIRDGFPNINRWMKNLYHNYPAFKDTTNFEHIKHHYCTSHPQINPTRIVPLGPIPHIQPL
ncbi:Glutathione S-transferase [Pseudohyphozyma bogoriensis]|nr:Glutathione S-transferase [Pseudohyphozyma bogoriensis]